ncbi:MAG TPA: hypothetical protein VGA38_05670 [Candidatus Limnocylindria bacterium]
MGILYPLALLVALVLGALGFGATLPVAHVATRTKRLPAQPQVVWGLINDPVATKGWGGNVKTEVVEQDEPRLLTTKIVGEKAFGGTWTYELAPEGHEATTLTITERGEIYNPLFRTVMRLMGHTRTIDAYLAKLETALT